LAGASSIARGLSIASETATVAALEQPGETTSRHEASN
jgi:hypothetical protein